MVNKYRSKITEIDGIKFHSKKEALRYRELLNLKSNGMIKDLILQPVFILQEKFKYKDETIRAIKYIADFQWTNRYSKEIIVEDVKGFKTDIYKLKRKLLLNKFPNINFVEV